MRRCSREGEQRPWILSNLVLWLCSDAAGILVTGADCLVIRNRVGGTNSSTNYNISAASAFGATKTASIASSNMESNLMV